MDRNQASGSTVPAPETIRSSICQALDAVEEVLGRGTGHGKERPHGMGVHAAARRASSSMAQRSSMISVHASPWAERGAEVFGRVSAHRGCEQTGRAGLGRG
jgi:hypothetical protein